MDASHLSSPSDSALEGHATFPAHAHPHALPERLTVTALLRKYLDPFLVEYGSQITPHVRRKLQRLAWCRTDMYGGHAWQCGSCGSEHHSYNGCRDRACPACAADSRGPWLELMQSWMLPIDYYQNVFTTPHYLNPLIGVNPNVCYQLHADSVREALCRVAADPVHGVAARIGLIMILHLWGQRMLRHMHTHVILPGGGISLETGQWVTFPARTFFLDATVLMETYRALFLKKLLRRYRAGKLVMPPELAHLQEDEPAFRQWLAPLQSQPWVIHCGTPRDTFRQDGAFRYLSNYVTGTAIRDSRILGDEDGQVTIRFKDYRDQRAWKTETMSGVEFVRRFALHIMPPHLRRVRYGGFLGTNQREAALRLARRALGVPQLEEDDDASATTLVRLDQPHDMTSSEHSPAAESGNDSLLERNTLVTPDGNLPLSGAQASSLEGSEPRATEAAEGVTVAAVTPKSAAEDPEADCNLRCPKCGERKLRWVHTLWAEAGWAVGRHQIPRRARERLQRQFDAHFAAPTARQRPPPLAGVT